MAGTKTSTWRFKDDKDLSVDDEVELIDKVNPRKVDSWQAIGLAKIDKITEKRLGQITADDYDGHESYPDQESMFRTYRQYYNDPSIGPNTSLKIVDFTFTAYQQPKYLDAQSATNHTKLKLYADGGSRGNPGPSASGYVLLDMDDNVIIKAGVYLGVTTNNQAEYQALKFGLAEAHKLGVQELEIYMDSLLVVNQIKGIFKIKNRDLWPIHVAIKQLLTQFKKVAITQIPRELNKLADAEVNSTLDAEAGK